MNKFPLKISEFLQISNQDVSNILKNLSNPLILKWAFIGDILLGFIVTMYLSKKFKDSTIHELTLYRAMIVCNKTLAFFCDEIFSQDIININKLNAHSKGTIIEALIYKATEINGLKLIKEKIHLMTNLILERNEIEFQKTIIQIKNPNFEDSIHFMTMTEQNSLIIENEINQPLLNSFLSELNFYVEKPIIKIDPKNEEKKSDILINDQNQKKENNKSNEKEKKKWFDPKTIQVSRPDELEELKLIIENLKKNQNINFNHFGKIILINWRSRKGNDHFNYFYSCCGIPSLSIEINRKENCGRMNWKNN